MNNEMMKAMNRQEKTHPIRKWWNNNSYKIYRVVFFPIWIIYLLKEKIVNVLCSHEVWCENKATEILNYYIPRRAEWCEAEQHFYFFDNGTGWDIQSAKPFLKRKDRRFWKIHTGWAGGRIRRFLIEDFQLEDCKKIKGNCTENWTEIIFKLN